MYYVGAGHGQYNQETNYRYVGCGGDFSNAPRRRDFTCLILLAALALLLALLALWCLWPTDECYIDQATWQYKWSRGRQLRCCARVGIGCPVNRPTATPGPIGPVDPFNCALGDLNWKAGWSQAKKKWCCKVHKKGCPGPGESWVAVPSAEYDCNAGFENFVKGWSSIKKVWCCAQHGKGCIGSGAMNAAQAASEGFGAGAQHGFRAAPVALPQMGTR